MEFNQLCTEIKIFQSKTQVMKHSCIFFLAFFISLALFATAQNPEQLFQEGLVKEEAEGALTEAIEIYNQIVENTEASRPIRARALLQVASCYDKMGQQKARNAYEKLIRDYGDQKELVSIAKKRLKNYSQPERKIPVQLTNQLLLSELSPKKGSFRVSPNGQYLAYMDWNQWEIMIRDLSTGKVSALTDGNTWVAKEHKNNTWSNPQNPIWSPDSKFILYSWFSHGRSEIRMKELEGTEPVTLFGLDHEGNYAPTELFPDLFDFTKNGRKLLCGKHHSAEMKSQDLFWYDADKNEWQFIHNFGMHFGSQFRISPDEKKLLYQRYSEESKSVDIFVYDLTTNHIQNISEHRAKDFGPRWSPDGKKVLFLSDRSGTNDLYVVDPDHQSGKDPAVMVKKNLGNKIIELIVCEDGSVFYVSNNERYDVYTLDTKALFEEDKIISERITDKVFAFGGHAPDFSQDGRYISYISWGSNFRDQVPKEIDNNLGDRYFLNIYDREKRTHREIETEIYTNHYWSDINEYIPNWSKDGSKLIIHGQVKTNYLGGFFMVDVHSGEVTGLKVSEQSIVSAPVRAGRFPKWSKHENKFFYTSNDWKELREFYVDDHRDQLINRDERGYFFRGTDDKEQNFYLYNGLGLFNYNRPKDSLSQVLPDNTQYIIGCSHDNKYWYSAESGDFSWIKGMTRISTSDPDKQKSVSFEEVFPDGRIWLIRFSPVEDLMVFDMKTNLGNDLYKLEGVLPD